MGTTVAAWPDLPEAIKAGIVAAVFGSLPRFSSAHAEASAMLSPSSSSSAIAAFAFGLRFFSAILEMTRCPSRPHAQTGADT